MNVQALIESTKDSLLPYGAPGLFALAFVESSFFIVPPDVLLIPMCILNADLSLFYAFVCTIGSVSGAIFGYYLGKKGGRPILLRFASQQKIEKVEDLFNEHGALAVALAAFTPIPYKVFTISSGVLNYKIHLFVLASIVGRGGRFFIEAAIMMHFGERMLAFVSSYFEVATLLFGIGVLFIYIVYRLWR